MIVANWTLFGDIYGALLDTQELKTIAQAFQEPTILEVHQIKNKMIMPPKSMTG